MEKDYSICQSNPNKGQIKHLQNKLLTCINYPAKSNWIKAFNSLLNMQEQRVVKMALQGVPKKAN